MVRLGLAAALMATTCASASASELRAVTPFKYAVDVTYTADPGERNQVVLSSLLGGITTVADLGAEIRSGGDALHDCQTFGRAGYCRPQGSFVVHRVLLGDGDDTLAALATPGVDGLETVDPGTEPFQIDCGPGHDRVVVRAVDVVANCEEVTRQP